MQKPGSQQDSPTTAPEPIRLDYGTSAPRWKTRFRRALAVASIAILLLVTIRWGPLAWRQARILYVQRQCLNHRPPPEQVVYEEDPAEAQKLVGRSNYVARSTIDPSSSGLQMIDEPK